MNKRGHCQHALLEQITEQLDSDTIRLHDLREREVSSLAEQSRWRREKSDKARERALDLEGEARGGRGTVGRDDFVASFLLFLDLGLQQGMHMSCLCVYPRATQRDVILLLTILEFIQQKLGSNVYATSGFPKWQASYPRIFCHHRKLTRVAWHLLIWLAVAPARMCDPFPRVQKLPVVEIRYVTWQFFKYRRGKIARRLYIPPLLRSFLFCIILTKI